jgi:hypothetical protein
MRLSFLTYPHPGFNSFLGLLLDGILSNTCQSLETPYLRCGLENNATGNVVKDTMMLELDSGVQSRSVYVI